jgi:hypothetical protein
MPYGSGNIVTAADFNAIAADVNEIYADIYPGSTTESTANNGYGQTPAVATVAANDTITAAQWTALFGAIDRCATHQGTAKTTPASVSVGALIDARAPFNVLLNDVTNIRTNKLNADAGQMTITSGGTFGTSTRTTSWSGPIQHVWDVIFTNWNQARFFFNAGGQIRIAASRTGGSSNNQNTSITNMLSGMGTIVFDHTQTTRTGAGGTATAIGFYNLTGSYQTIFSTAGTGAYTGDSYVLAAYVISGPGGSGTIRFRATISQTNDGSVNTLPDGTLSNLVDTRRATGALTITAPSYSLVTALSSGA